MSRLILICLVILTIAFGCGNENKMPMWVFNSSSTTSNIDEYLNSEHYKYKRVDTIFNNERVTAYYGDKYVVDYAGIDWDDFMIGCFNDSIYFVAFNRLGSNSEPLSDIQADNLISNLDAIYGKHREDRNDAKDYFQGRIKKWDWEKNNIFVNLSISSVNTSNDVIMLEISKGDPELMSKRLRIE